MNHVQHRDPKGALRDKLRYVGTYLIIHFGSVADLHVFQAREIALGLEFLHKSDITHGNLHIVSSK